MQVQKLLLKSGLKKQLFLNVFLFVTIVLVSACSTKVGFQNSSLVPAASGHVKMKKDNNGNYKVSVSIRNLIDADKLVPAKKAYVIWMVTNQAAAKNVGLINSGTKMFSKKLKANFVTVSAAKPIKIFITAEDDVSIQTPNYTNVLETNSF